MSFSGTLLEAHMRILGSGVAAAQHVQEDSTHWAPTTEPISTGWKSLIVNEILDVAAANSVADWDCEGAEAISGEAIRKAINLIQLAPEWIRPPEIVPSSDGEIVFEWRMGRERIMSLAFHDNELIFAAILGSRNNRERGCKPYTAGWPDRVLEILTHYFPYVQSTATSNH